MVSVSEMHSMRPQICQSAIAVNIVGDPLVRERNPC